MTNRYASDAVFILADVKRRLPDSEVVVHPFAALWPVYETTLTVTALTPHELSTTARFILRVAALGVGELPELARTLGLSEDHAAAAAADLLRSGHIVQMPDKGIALTDAGQQALSGRISSFIPQSHYLRVAYDPLAGVVTDLAGSRLLNVHQARRGGEFVIPAEHRKPRLSNLRMEDVKAAARGNRFFQDLGEITQISRIQSAILKYRSGITLVGAKERHSDSLIFFAYRGRRYLADQTEAVRRIAADGVDLVPQDSARESAKDWIAQAVETAEDRQRLETIVDLTQRVGESDKGIAVEREIRKSAQDERERAESSKKISNLEAEKRELALRLAQAERQLGDDSQGKERLLKTEEHRAVLLRAINESSSELTLVSAWITPRAFDHEIRRGIVNALKRGATVRIAWGMPIDKRRQSEGDRNRDVGVRLIRDLRGMIPRSLRSAFKDKMAGTHEKFIICDDRFCAAGSLNWLSYRGDLDEGYRDEVSLYSERRTIIDMYKERAARIFGG